MHLLVKNTLRSAIRNSKGDDLQQHIEAKVCHGDVTTSQEGASVLIQPVLEAGHSVMKGLAIEELLGLGHNVSFHSHL